MSISDGFKLTEIGEIPVDWEAVRLDSLALSHKGAVRIGPFGSQLKKSELSATGIKVYGQENVMSKDFSTGARYVDPEKYRALRNFEVFPSDVLVTMMGSLGFSSVVPSGAKKGIMDSHLLRIQVDQKRVLPSYVALLLGESQTIKRQITKLRQGAIMVGLNSRLVRSLLLPLPSLQEQQGITQILSICEEAIQKTEAIVAEIQQLRKGLMQRLLTRGIGHATFKRTEIGEMPEQWRLVRLGDVCELLPGYAFKSSEFVKSGVKLLRGANIGIEEIRWDDTKYFPEGRFEEFSKYAVHGRDIVIGMDRPFVRNGIKVAVVPQSDDHCLLVQRVGKFIPSGDITRQFLYSYLRSGIFKNHLRLQQQGMDLPHISQGDIESAHLPLPPVHEQETIGSILGNLDEKLRIETWRNSKLVSIKKGLMHVLLTGKVRVKVG
jgi:type I restriction enzyme S subunit